MPIRVLLADDHQLFRQGLRKLLEREDDLAIVGEANDGREAVATTKRLRPDVVLMDVRMMGMAGISAARQILEAEPSTGVIILTTHDDDEQLQDALRAGARGYLLKTSRAEQVVAAIRAVYAGQSLLEPAMTARMFSHYRRLQAGGKPEGPLLTEKEAAVLRLLGMGRSNKEIARELNYSESTVKNRLSTIFEKIGVQDRTQAAIYAVKNGLLKLDDAPAP